MMIMDDILKEVAQKLVDCCLGKTTLRFPKYRNDSDRISEQESKFFFSIVFDKQKSPFSFAVEVPTDVTYIFTGKTPRSALHDMAIYVDGDTSKFKWIIELKSGQPEEESIKKDFKKMKGSKCNCVWFHTLKNANSRTFSVLLTKFRKAWEALNLEKENEHEWHFAIIVLESQVLYRKTIKTDSKSPFHNEISDWPKIEL
jgi:hypothetical protein